MIQLLIRSLKSFTALSLLCLHCSTTSTRITTIAPGLTLEITRNSKPPSYTFYTLKIDPQQRTIKLEHALGDGCSRTPVSSLVDHVNGLAGLNANNYRRGGAYNGNAVDFLKIKNHFYADPGIQRSAISWNESDSIPLIGELRSSTQLWIDKKRYRVDRVNQPRAENEAILYTTAFGPSTQTNKNGCEIVIENDRIVKIAHQAGNSTIPSDGAVYSMAHSCRRKNITCIKEGMQAHIAHHIGLKKGKKYIDVSHRDYITSGAGVLILNGAKVKDLNNDFKKDKPITHCPDEIAADFSIEKERDWLIREPHPRTAVGVLPDGKWLFVVVDGRQAGYSSGISLPDLAQWMLEQGCVNALNLGGGGCSTLCAQGKIVNSPCGTTTHAKLTTQKEKLAHERPVCSAFIIQ